MFSEKKWNRFKLADVFNKTEGNVRRSSKSGAFFTWLALTITVSLILYEFISFESEELVEVISLEKERESNMLLYIDIAFPDMICEDTNLDVVDQMGNEPFIALRQIKKTPYISDTPQKFYCRSCSDDPKTCCTCDEIYELLRNFGALLPPHLRPDDCQIFDESVLGASTDSLRKKAGCRVTAMLNIPKMKGNLHFAPGRSVKDSGGHVHQLDYNTLATGFKNIRLSHRINVLSFGPKYPGMQVPLTSVTQDHAALVKQTYFIDLVPTVYLDDSAYPTITNQYSVTNYTLPVDVMIDYGMLPGVFFSWDISPMLISITEVDKSFFHLLTRICAVVGGTWTVIGLIHSIFLTAIEKRQK